MTDKKKKNELERLKDSQVESDDEGGEGSAGTGQEESWTHILDSMGYDTRAMSLAEIKAIIRNYSEGKQNYSNVFDIKSGEVVSKINRKQEKDTQREYTVATNKSGPASSDEVVEKKKTDEHKRSEKEDKHTPSGPVLGPRGPKPPSPG